MNTVLIAHIKGQLEAIKQANNLDYAKGLIDGLLAFIDTSCPKEIKLRIAGRPQNLIMAIKLVRTLTGLGLAEAKQLVEQNGVFYTGTDFNHAMQLKRSFEKENVSVEVIGDGTVGLLFAKD